MYQRILVPIDGSPTSTRGLDEAIRLAKLTGATLHLVHVLDELVSPPVSTPEPRTRTTFCRGSRRPARAFS